MKYWLEKNKEILTWFCCDTNSGRNFITKWSRHCETWNILSFEPDSKRSNRIIIGISEWVNPTSEFMDSCSFICLARFLISWNGLCDDLTCHVPLLFLHDDASGVSDVRAEEFLAHSKQSNTSWAAESDVHYSWKELIIAVEESIVECNTHFISVECLILRVLL